PAPPARAGAERRGRPPPLRHLRAHGAPRLRRRHDDRSRPRVLFREGDVRRTGGVLRCGGAPRHAGRERRGRARDDRRAPRVLLVAHRPRREEGGARSQAGRVPAAGIAAGLALLATLPALLLFPATAIVLLGTRSGRSQLRRAGPYAAAALAAVVALPALIWNARHGWVTLLMRVGYQVSPRFTLRPLAEL